MTDLQTAIASGQVSAAQIEAHHEAGELPIEMFEPVKTGDQYITPEHFDGTTHIWCKVSDVRKALDDAERYQWLKKRLLCADFSYGDPSEPCCALIFEISDDIQVSADLDATIDRAIKAIS